MKKGINNVNITGSALTGNNKQVALQNTGTNITIKEGILNNIIKKDVIEPYNLNVTNIFGFGLLWFIILLSILIFLFSKLSMLYLEKKIKDKFSFIYKFLYKKEDNLVKIKEKTTVFSKIIGISLALLFSYILYNPTMNFITDKIFKKPAGFEKVINTYEKKAYNKEILTVSYPVVHYYEDVLTSTGLKLESIKINKELNKITKKNDTNINTGTKDGLELKLEPNTFYYSKIDNKNTFGPSIIAFFSNELINNKVDFIKMQTIQKKIDKIGFKKLSNKEKEIYLENLYKLYLLVKYGKVKIYMFKEIPESKIYKFVYIENLKEIPWLNDFINLYLNGKTKIIKFDDNVIFVGIMKLLIDLLFVGLFTYLIFISFRGLSGIDGGYDLVKTKPSDISLDTDVKYGGNKHLKEILEEIKILYNKKILDKYFDGILLYGPPGTGKTLFGKVISKELGLPFYYISSNNLKSSYYGGTSRKINNLFKNILKDIKQDGYESAIIFIDELDSIGLKRNHSHEATSEGLNTLLTLIDGFKKNKFIIIGATNRFEVLDEALLSRLNNKIYVGPPNKEERKEITENQLIFSLKSFLE